MPLWASVIVAIVSALIPAIEAGEPWDYDVVKALGALFSAIPQSTWLALEAYALTEAGIVFGAALTFLKNWWNSIPENANWQWPENGDWSRFPYAAQGFAVPSPTGDGGQPPP